MNKLYYGDNLEVMRKYIGSNTIDLCYIDPPFNSKKNYNQIYDKIGEEDRAQAQAFIDTWTWDDEAEKGLDQIRNNYGRVFTKQSIDLINGLETVLGKKDLLAYLVNMTLRIAEIFRTLKYTGSFYLHCDSTASHYLKLILDTIFNNINFKREIIWNLGNPSGYKSLAKNWIRNHDTILFYTKSKNFTFNKDYIPYSKDDLIKYPQKNNRKGIAVSDVWSDIPSMQKWGGSREDLLGYGTQKPTKLLKRIIKASSNENETILDAYCGCGTTIDAAQELSRNWIGVDITYQSISLILKRFEDTFGKSVLDNIYLDGIPKDIDSAIALAHRKDDRVRKEFEKWAVLTYTNNRAIINDKKGADKGIDGVSYFQSDATTTSKIIFQVKSGNVKRGDIATLNSDRQREKAELAYFLTLEEPTQPMKDEAKIIGVYHSEYTNKDRIQIITIKDIIENKVRLDIPMSYDVLKKAKLKARNYQASFIDD